jgi:uracil-DNA glycosylase
MKAEHIAQMVDGLTPTTKEFIRRAKAPLTTCIQKFNAMVTDINTVVPAPGLILNALRLCPIENVKIVILGQDPYPKKSDSHGLSFSVPAGAKTPTALKNIFKLQVAQNLLSAIPPNGDLTQWASRGVLMLNISLTTVVKKTNAHPHVWNEFVDAIISELPDAVYILLGKPPLAKIPFIKSKHVFCWGHPSGLTAVNRKECPENFKYCDVFTKATAITGISWELNVVNHELKGLLGMIDDALDGAVATALATAAQATPAATAAQATPAATTVTQPAKMDPVLPNVVYNIPTMRKQTPDDVIVPDGIRVYTDGSAYNNGKPDCKAAYAYYITDNSTVTLGSGLVDGKQSNNTAELTAILQALQAVSVEYGVTAGTQSTVGSPQITVVSDSDYSIKSITEWSNKWTAKSKKENMTLILQCKKLADSLKVKFIHINSHMLEKNIKPGTLVCDWKLNDTVDKMCNGLVGN